MRVLLGNDYLASIINFEECLHLMKSCHQSHFINVHFPIIFSHFRPMSLNYQHGEVVKYELFDRSLNSFLML